VVYGQREREGAAVSGPTLASCRRSGDALLIDFSQEVLGKETVVVQPSYTWPSGREKSLLEVLAAPDTSTFCMQPMQRCKKENDTQCIYQHREWFCPSALGFDHDPSALSKSGIVDFTSIHGNMMAYMPPDGPWEKSWRAVHITQTSAYQIAANLTGLDGLPIHAVRFAWGVFTTTRDETRCNKADEPLVGLSRPCEREDEDR